MLSAVGKVGPHSGFGAALLGPPFLASGIVVKGTGFWEADLGWNLIFFFFRLISCAIVGNLLAPVTFHLLIREMGITPSYLTGLL